MTTNNWQQKFDNFDDIFGFLAAICDSQLDFKDTVG